MAFNNLDFLNANQHRNFPIREGLTKRSVDGTHTLPDNLIADLTLCASSNAENQSFYLSRVSFNDQSVYLEVSDASFVVCGSFTVAVATHVLFAEYPLVSSEEYLAANGRICVGHLDALLALPHGTFDFTPATTELEPRAIVPSLTVPNSLTFVTPAATFTVTGQVKLYARNNLRFTQDGPSSVILDAGDGLGLNVTCAPVAPYIKTINGQRPTLDGNFTIVPADCAAFSTITTGGVAGLLLSDTCCKPCMGCEEVDQLVNRLEQMESEMLALRDNYQRLRAVATEFSTLLGFSCEC